MTDSTTKKEILVILVLCMSVCVSIMVRWWVYSSYEKVKDSKNARELDPNERRVETVGNNNTWTG